MHTGRACANSNANNPLMLLACSVDTPIHIKKFHLLALCKRVQCGSALGSRLGWHSGPAVRPPGGRLSQGGGLKHEHRGGVNAFPVQVDVACVADV